MALFTKLRRVVIGLFFAIGFASLLFMMVMIVGNSLGRVFFNTPIKLTIEGAGLAGVILVSIAIGYAEKERINITIRLIFERFSQRVRLVLESFTLFLSLGGIFYLLWAVYNSAMYSLSIKEHINATVIPVTPFRFAWAAGILILGLFLVQHLIEDINKLVRGMKK